MYSLSHKILLKKNKIITAITSAIKWFTSPYLLSSPTKSLYVSLKTFSITRNITSGWLNSTRNLLCSISNKMTSSS